MSQESKNLKNINKIWILLTFIISFIPIVNADNLYSDSIILTSGTNQASLYKLDNKLPNKFAEKISMRRNLNSLEEFASRLQTLTTLRSKIINQPIVINNNQIYILQQIGTITDLLNQIAVKFDTSWKWDSKTQTIFFEYNKPKITYVKAIKSTNISAPIIAVKPIIKPTWNYDLSDKKISTTLNKWAKQANYQLIWKSQDDFEVQTSGTIHGSFKEAINEVLRSFKNTETPLKANWYPNNVVVILPLN